MSKWCECAIAAVLKTLHKHELGKERNKERTKQLNNNTTKKPNKTDRKKAYKLSELERE